MRFANSGADYGSALASHMRAQGVKRIAIVKTENQYIEAILTGFKNSAQGIAIEIIDNYQPGDQDFKASVAKIKNRSYDAIGIFLLTGQGALFAKQIRAHQITAPFYGTDFFESLNEVRQSNGALMGGVFANNQASPVFYKTYTTRFGNDVQLGHAASGYDFVRLMCGELSTSLIGKSAGEIMKIVSSVAPFQSAQGDARFSATVSGDKYFRFPVVLRRVESDKIVTISTP